MVAMVAMAGFGRREWPGVAAKSGPKVTIYDEVTGIHATGTVADLGSATTLTPTGTVVGIG
jgi:hypothetical protein